MKDYRDVIIRPVITEESVSAMDGLRKYTFEVPTKVNKIEVRQAIENLFDVQVEKVNIVNTADKPKRFGRWMSTKHGFKKAIVTLKENNSIDIFGEEE